MRSRTDHVIQDKEQHQLHWKGDIGGGPTNAADNLHSTIGFETILSIPEELPPTLKGGIEQSNKFQRCLNEPLQPKTKIIVSILNNNKNIDNKVTTQIIGDFPAD